MSVEELKEEALRLSPEAMSDDELEKLWIAEAIRRDDELDRGTAQSYPANEVLDRIRARRK